MRRWTAPGPALRRSRGWSSSSERQPYPTELAARVGVTPGAISQQLAQLRRAGIVEAHRSGQGVYSSLTPLGTQLVELLSD
ncbi:MAG: helix-turn-helix domain-containing protein [Actinomycetota bacterium]